MTPTDKAAQGTQTDAPARYLEDFQVGERWTSAPTVISEAEIIAFGLANDPQPMHTDPEAARHGPFGGLVASGWQIAALSMRLFVQAGGYGKTPVVGMGIDELRWRKAVRPGDTLTVEREVVAITPSAAGDKGTLHTRVDVRNQSGEVVMSLRTLGRVPARPR
ncbi:MaoC family dehydratase [Hydrogenophaga sp.]|uniref:MaoC family dehydratase n=1 Tax=Hydrogenophaga sp. TaxID=1904254 RepID=UPI003D0E22E1